MPMENGGLGRLAAAGALLLLACPSDDGGGSADTGASTMMSMTSAPGSGDSGSSGSGGNCAVSFETDLQPILDASCTPACHETGPPPGEWSLLPLTADAAYDNLTGRSATSWDPPTDGPQLVVPGDADASAMIFKLEDTFMAMGGTGCNMPKNANGNAIDCMAPPAASPLPQAEIDLFREWIDCGAPEN